MTTRKYVDSDGSWLERTTNAEGLIHSEDGPAEIEYGADGSVFRERWFLDGFLSRRGGPAAIEYFAGTDVVFRREWLRERNRHRLDGPAVFRYSDTGLVVETAWFLDGYECLGPSGIAAVTRGWSEKRLRDELADTVFAALVSAGFEPRRIVEAIGAGITTAEGAAEFLSGAPAEWVRSFESGVS